MQVAQKYSIKDTRDQLSELVDQVAIGRRQFIITKFGKPKAMLIPIQEETIDERRNRLLAGFGMWKDRKDIKDSAKWVANLRKRMSTRYGYGKLFD